MNLKFGCKMQNMNTIQFGQAYHWFLSKGQINCQI